MGGIVRIDTQGENLCRRIRPDDGITTLTRTDLGQDSTSGPAEPGFLIEAQGLPNLVHELVHALFLGRLEDDHGFDYGLIPLDLRDPAQRRHLWEELACCAISTAYSEPFAADPPTFRHEWFAEQFEIQGVFHGLEDDLPAFQARIDSLLSKPSLSGELAEVVDEGYRRVEAALTAVGAEPEIAHVPVRLDVEILWTAYRRQSSSFPGSKS